MTRAKPGLLQARQLLLEYLDLRPGTVHADLDPAEVGIVGGPAHFGGYHCGSDRLVRQGGTIVDYSVVESSRDRRGLAAKPDEASAIDIGWFEVRVGGVTHNLYTFNAWLVGLCEAGDPDTADIREIIYSLDGRTVRRWDRLRIRSGGDDSHLWHTHASEFRDANGARMVRLARRYLTHIGLLEDDVTPDELRKIVREETEKVVRHEVWGQGSAAPEYYDANRSGQREPRTAKGILWDAGAYSARALHSIQALAASLTATEARQVARDAAQTELLRQVLAAGGQPLSPEQLDATIAAMREAAARAGQEATARLEQLLVEQRAALAAAARAGADALALPDTPAT